MKKYIFSKVLRLVADLAKQNPRPTILQGPASSGKTSFVKAVARELGCDRVYNLVINQFMLPEDVFCRPDLDGIVRGVNGWLPSEIWEAFEASQNTMVVIRVDELDKGSKKIWDLFLGLLDDESDTGWRFRSPKLGCDGLPAWISGKKENIRFFFTSNAEKELSGPLLSRCRVANFEYPDMLRMYDICCEEVPGHPRALCDLLWRLGEVVGQVFGADKRPGARAIIGALQDLSSLDETADKGVVATVVALNMFASGASESIKEFWKDGDWARAVKTELGKWK